MKGFHLRQNDITGASPEFWNCINEARPAAYGSMMQSCKVVDPVGCGSQSNAGEESGCNGFWAEDLRGFEPAPRGR